MAGERLLLVDDEDNLRSMLEAALRYEGFDVHAAASGRDALDVVEVQSPDLIVLDVMMPDLDGFEVCRRLRNDGVKTPVLFLTARDAVTDRLSGFRAGGDDYVVKPFHFDEVVERVRALLRRAGAETATEVGPLRLDPLTHAVAGDAGEVSLTPTEFRVLAALAAAPGVVVRRRDLVRAAWPEGAIVHDNTLDQYVARLRRKLRSISDEVGIATSHGVGYRLR